MSVSDIQMAYLSKNNNRLYLDGLPYISYKQAELLSQHKKYLSLRGLTSVDDIHIS